MRAALDHIAYRLATSYSESLPKEALASIEFPIFTDPDKFILVDKRGESARGSGLSKLRHADPAVTPVIEAMQPYNGERWEPLAELHDLDRIDKHRQLHVTVAMSHEVEIDCGDNAKVQQFTFHPPGRAIEDGEALCRFVCVHKQGRQGKIKPRANATFSVALREGSRPWAVPIVEQLASMDQLIRDEVIVRLAPFLLV
jgi:hypothetical protein